ncbi:MAG: ABC transporter ATP-binding protein [Dehalococcoidia bacterium]|nr:ABC transporter ATP-binding protein [Dehalococcoidia bacterium]
MRSLSFSYSNGDALFKSFDWRVEAGEAWAVIGPSGCGKTTLLYLLAGLRQPSLGQVLVRGQPLLRPRLETGLILQDYGLLPWATAFENVALGMRVRGAPSREARERATGWMERLGISQVAGHYPAQMSGGQRQRAAIARTLTLEPDLLLMDEPFSSLDALTREEMQDLLLALGLGEHFTTVLVTHSIEEAVLLGRRILVLTHPPIVQAQVVENPGSGEPDYRDDPTFLHMCRRVRGLVQGATGRAMR